MADMGKDLYPSCGRGSRLVLMVRDPYTLFTYWEVSQERQQILQEYFGYATDEMPLLLRIYRLNDQEFPVEYRDLEVSSADNWYIKGLSPGTGYQAEIMMIAPNGYYFQILRSNLVNTPRDSACLIEEGDDKQEQEQQKQQEQLEQGKWQPSKVEMPEIISSYSVFKK